MMLPILGDIPSANPVFLIIGSGFLLARVSAPNADEAKKVYRTKFPKYENRELRAEQLFSS